VTALPLQWTSNHKTKNPKMDLLDKYSKVRAKTKKMDNYMQVNIHE